MQGNLNLMFDERPLGNTGEAELCSSAVSKNFAKTLA